MRSMSERDRSATESRCRRGVATARGSDTVPVLTLADQEDAVALVDLDELDLDPLVPTRRKVLADVVGTDRKLAVASTHEHRELDPCRTAELEKGVDRRADRPARVQDVVDEHDGHALDREGDARRADDRLTIGQAASVADVDVVAVERDVQRSDRGRDTAPLLDEAPKSRCERRAAGLDADECD